MHNHPFIRSVEKSIHHFGMLQSGDTVLVGVSGGPDSVALLHALVALQSRLDFKVRVAHLNHGLRPSAAAADAGFVADLCRRHGLRCHCETIDPGMDLNPRHGSQEAQARHVRYDFFFRIARKNRYTKIAVGHHADDNAELVLMNLFRGSGSLGLAGIPPVREARIIRPLFRQTRRQIKTFLQTFKLAFVEDGTNRDTRFLRNRVRHELLPDLKRRYNPNLAAALNRTADVLRSENDFLQQAARQAWKQAVLVQDSVLHLSIASLLRLHEALQRRVVRLAVAELKGDLRKVTLGHIDAVMTLGRQGKTGQHLNLPDGILVQRYPQDDLRFSKVPIRFREPARKQGVEAIPIYKVSLPHADSGVVHNKINPFDMTLVCRHMPADSRLNPSSAGQNTAFFDMDKLTSPLGLRAVLPGDRFRPLGMTGTQKVKNFLINAKIPREERRRTRVLLNQNRIVWLLGLRIDDRVKITQQTRNVLKISLA